jgi:L-2,4-diaminobutyrate decarboxylase
MSKLIMIDMQKDSHVFKKAWQYVGEVILNAYMKPENHNIINIDSVILDKLDFPESIPNIGDTTENILLEAVSLIFKGYCNVLNPSYYGYISPRPLLISILGDALASGLNQTPGAWRAGPSATVIEKEVLKWLAEFVGYNSINTGKFPNGIITSGGTMANASALKLARDIIMGRSVQFKGLSQFKKKPLFYMSIEGHFSISKSLDLMGFGRDSLRTISINKMGSIDLSILSKVINDDKSKGYLPLCIIGVAGTSSTGSIDDLNALANIAKEHKMWFHVDAAAGGVFAKLPMTSKMFSGIELADSITIDQCKWLFLSFGIGCLLVKDGKELYRSFNSSGPYWEEFNDLDTFQMGFSGTRQWRSLGLWMAFKSIGSDGYLELLENNLNNVHYIATIIKKEKKFELLLEPTLPVCCFRLIDPLPDMTINQTNKFIQQKIYELKEHYVTLLDWYGTIYLRISINNYINKTVHLDKLLISILNIIQNTQQNF